MPSLILGTEQLQCEEEQTVQGAKETHVIGGGEEECRQNGNAGHEPDMEEQETKPEEEHTSNSSAESPSEGQQ